MQTDIVPHPESGSLPAPTRWELLRDAIVLQGKLLVDGLRDLMLGPLSIAAAALDFLGVGSRPGQYFYDVVQFGRRTEHWINLFGAAERALPGGAESPPEGIDRLVEKLERVVVEEYERGGITTSAKRVVDRALDSLQPRP